MKKITIKPKLNGWTVEVGCQEVVFQDRKDMLAEIDRYIRNPEEVAKEYAENAVNEDTSKRLTANSGIVQISGTVDSNW